TDLTTRLQRIPGVQAVSAMSGLPPNRDANANDTDFEGIPQTTDGPAQNVDYYQVTTAQYFAAMRIPLRRGRGFVPGDVGGPPVVVINEALAKRFYPDVDPVGRRMRPSSSDEVPWFTIVGVAADVKQG